MPLATRDLNIQPKALIHQQADAFLFSHSLGRTATVPNAVQTVASVRRCYGPSPTTDIRFREGGPSVPALRRRGQSALLCDLPGRRRIIVKKGQWVFPHCPCSKL